MIIADTGNPFSDINDIQLTQTTYFTSKNKDLKKWKKINEAYCDNSSLNLRLLASVLNAIVTQDLPVFLMSKRLLEKLIRKDRNVKRKTLSGQDYKFFILSMTKINGYFEVVSPWHYFERPITNIDRMNAQKKLSKNNKVKNKVGLTSKTTILDRRAAVMCLSPKHFGDTVKKCILNRYGKDKEWEISFNILRDKARDIQMARHDLNKCEHDFMTRVSTDHITKELHHPYVPQNHNEGNVDILAMVKNGQLGFIEKEIIDVKTQDDNEKKVILHGHDSDDSNNNYRGLDDNGAAPQDENKSSSNMGFLAATSHLSSLKAFSICNKNVLRPYSKNILNKYVFTLATNRQVLSENLSPFLFLFPVGVKDKGKSISISKSLVSNVRSKGLEDYFKLLDIEGKENPPTPFNASNQYWNIPNENITEENDFKNSFQKPVLKSENEIYQEWQKESAELICENLVKGKPIVDADVSSTSRYSGTLEPDLGKLGLGVGEKVKDAEEVVLRFMSLAQTKEEFRPFQVRQIDQAISEIGKDGLMAVVEYSVANWETLRGSEKLDGAKLIETPNLNQILAPWRYRMLNGRIKKINERRNFENKKILESEVEERKQANQFLGMLTKNKNLRDER